MAATQTVIYLHQYFRTPAEGGALRSWFVAEELTRQGIRVEMITAHNQPTYQRRALHALLTVHYLPVPYANKFGVVARSWAFMAFGWRALRLAGRLVSETGAAGTVCFATSTPLSIGVVARLLRLWRGLPYTFEVRDLWPEAPIQLGYVRAAPVRWLLRRAEKWIYDGARHLIALSPGMVSGIQATHTPTSVTLVPNMADTEAFHTAYAGTSSANETFVILYAGALGRANHVGFLLDAAEAVSLAGLMKVKFVIAGEGAESPALQAETTRRGLTNVEFVGALNRAEIQQWRARAAASFTCFDTVPVLDTTSPNKFFEGLAAGALSITTTGGWLRELVESNDCGFGYQPRRPEEFVEKLRPFVLDRTRLLTAQRNARKLAESQFSRAHLTAEAVRIITA